MSDQTFQKKL
uniref:Uncharacterized protein n=1 Tax=Rhizophora mucronata TaxID=61149 RepID=A0A2P2NTL0_RHIMU